ncbi:putative rmlC-like cupin domain superfamily, rmlC-like jelly roll protein [Helianthus anomalus]
MLFVAILLVSATLSLGSDELGSKYRPSSTEPDSDYYACKLKCVKMSGGVDEKLKCRNECEEKQMQKERGKGSGETDPEYRGCKAECEKIPGAVEIERLRCKKGCEDYHDEKQKRERGGGQGRRGGGQYNIVFAEEAQDVRKMVGECHQSCQGSQGEQQHPQCFQSCIQKRLQEQGRRQTGDTRRPETTRRTDKPYRQQSNNPYVFEDHHFTARLETEHGNLRVLQKFTDRSELFNGIEKYRAAFLEVEPQTFVVPNHWDADVLAFVANGQGTITLIEGDSRQSHNVKRGDLFHVPAGITAYLINTDNNERLVLAKILHSVSVPGDLQLFSVGGGEAESSYYNAFSIEVLEAAFGVDRESAHKMVGQQKLQQGVFKKVTEEQIRSFSGEDKSRGWPFGDRKGKGRGTHSIYKNEPSVANENGILHEVDSKDFPDLRDINVAFSLFNITQGSMAGPFYNTKATMVLMVSNGGGRFEMACPHLAEQGTRGGQINPRYEQVSSELRRGTVVVIPAGHPVVIEASNEQNLEVIGFGLNSDENEWFPLTGRDNILSQWEDEALELTFGFPASELQSVIQKQNKKLFFKAPERSGRAFA